MSVGGTQDVNLGCGLNEGLFNSKLKSIEVGVLGVGSFLVWRPGLRALRQVGADQTGKWTEDGEKANGSRGPANYFTGAKILGS